MMFRKVLICFLFLSTASTAVAKNTQNCIEKYEIDKEHTNIVWYANRMGFSRTIGQFNKFEGEITLNTCDPSKSNIYITIDTASITSGVPALDKQLKSDLFFNVEKFPTAIFESTDVALIEKDTADIKGNFTMLGVTREIIINVRFNKRAVDIMVNRMRTGFSIKTAVERSKWGMDKLLAFAGDKINIVIEAEALRIKP